MPHWWVALLQRFGWGGDTYSILVLLMKVVHLSQTDSGAGAGRAAYRIHRSLLAMGLDSSMIVGEKRTSDDTVGLAVDGWLGKWRSRVPAYLESKYARRLTQRGTGLFSPASFGHFNLASDVRVQNGDVVCLYWINGGFIRPEDLAGLSRPLVWRLSDIWPFSGGCHYPGECERFIERCGECPKLVGQGPDDRSRRLWKRKLQAWRDLNLTIVAPSQWIAGLAAKSSLFRDRRIEVIATGVDTMVFRPQDRIAARASFGLPEGRRIIVFGAAGTIRDARKGWSELSRSIAQVVQRGHGQDWHIAVFGVDVIPPLPLPATALGIITDECRLAQLYACADAVAVPSLEDNLPQVALEALACGTPVVAFRVGGLPDAVTHRENGWLAKAGDIGEFAEGLMWVLGTGEGPRLAARRHAKINFSQQAQVARYAALLCELAGAGR